MGTVEVVIPWRGGCPHREAALEWVTDRWLALGWPVTVAEHAVGPWVKAKAVTPAVEASTADTIVVADADVWCDAVGDAVEQAGRRWAIPHKYVHRLDQPSTADVYAGGDPNLGHRQERPYRGHAGGGIVVLPRSLYLDVPLDPRFEGWGQEDDAWAQALTVVAGKPWRGQAPLWHLYHPTQPRRSRAIGSEASLALGRRYTAARTPDAVRRLLDEFRLQQNNRNDGDDDDRHDARDERDTDRHRRGDRFAGDPLATTGGR